ncbi:transcription factor iws1 [Lentinula aciculospora]|uniref:Transcription factor iws1 n=1 Tax=Lentinula aciculospora TaxID=153920 RepID=A0A9W9AAF4_9AGAR|nr:transcription factor iws1 [Lentinula aciculospora]
MSTDKLARDIFGGSDSELSSDDDEVQDRRLGTGAYDEEDDGGSGADSEDEYREKQPSASSSRKKKSKKTGKPKQRVSGEGDEGGDTRKRKRTGAASKKTKKNSALEDIDLSELPPEQANKIRLDRQIEAILKTKKSSRPKKRKNNDEVLDSFADDEVARLRETMNNAAEEDMKANQEKQPATAKLRFLGEAMETLRKASLAQSIVDNNLLDAVKRWLEPLPDRSLPALNIQRELFITLRKMEFIDSSVLKESGLGPLVLFYTKCPRVQPDVKRVANELVSTWSRPIIKRSASYRDRVVPTIYNMDVDDVGPGSHSNSQGQSQSQYRPEKLNAILARAREEDKNRIRKNAVSIPQSSLGTYTVAPRNNAGLAKMNVSVDNDVERRKKNAERLKSLTRKVVGK